MISVEEHLAACLAAVAPRAAQAVPLLDAVGCVLAHQVRADAPLPAFDASAMDGYAVRAADLAGASADAPVVLPLTGDLPAGAPAPLSLEPGTAIRIMTGAPVPHGADAVVPVEATDAGGGTDAAGGPGTGEVRISEQPRVGAHVRPAGDGVRVGDVLVEAGVRLRPRHVALLAAAGHATVPVRPRPRVVVVSTGDELVEVGQPLAFGQVHDSNSPALVAAARAAGALAQRVRAVGDETSGPGSLLGVLVDAAQRADVLVTTGGVSAGAYDVVKAVLSQTGAARFVAVAMQPGKPQGLGAVTAADGRHVPVFTLPGNPVSAYVSFEVFVRPALRAMLGHSRPRRVPVRATARAGWSSAPGKRQFVRALLGGAPGALTVAPVGGHGSHLVADLAHADCLVDVPADTVRVEAGQVVECLLLDDGALDHEERP